jgi:hypothetical protein
MTVSQILFYGNVYDLSLDVTRPLKSYDSTLL